MKKTTLKITGAFLTILILLLTKTVSAQHAPQRHYWLLSPVPKDKLREMETDRPDVTESAITIDAGHFQYESDVFTFERENSDESTQNTLTINKANLKFGLAGSTSLQIGVETYVWQNEKDRQSGALERNSGLGDINIRVKQNLIGNNKGNFALAILPYIKLPTATYTDDSKFEEGLIVPLQLKLPGDWKLGMQLDLDHLKDKTGPLMHMEYLQALTVNHDLIKNVSAIAETYFTYDFKQHHYLNYLNAALQVEIAHDFKVDGGVNYGIQKDALRRYFLGLSVRM